MKSRLSAAAALGALAVMLGAFGAHAIAKSVTPAELETWKTASHYHLVHAVALTGLALSDREDHFRVTRLLWWIGIVIFSVTLYALVLTHVKWLGAITPVGGACLIAGWISLAVQAARAER
jgi:uncharacterized membrane protein YgdD (TMEM256/DUF423 family)